MKKIFILGCPRTGSKIYMHILNQFSSIDIIQEMHFLSLKWLHKDFVWNVKNEIGDLKKNTNILKLIDLMYSRKLKGTFWRNIDLDKKCLQHEIMNSDRSFKSIFEILLHEHAKSRGKTICGAKFPVHFSYMQKLLEWFPECKIIHLIRDPRAIYSSQANKYVRNSYSIQRNVQIRLKTFAYVNFIYSWAVRIHNRFKHLDNYYLSRYEDIVNRPDQYLKELCDFLEIEFKKDMLYPPIKDSSYMISERNGFQKKSINRWKKYISPTSAKLIVILNKKYMKELGYYQ